MSQGAEKQAELNREIREIRARLAGYDRDREDYSGNREEAAAALEEAEQKAAEARNQENRLREEQEKLEGDIETAEAEVVRLEEQDKSLRAELSGLFALAFGKKKETRARIEANEKELEQAKEKLAGLESSRAPEQLEQLTGEAKQAEEAVPPLKTALEEWDRKLAELAQTRRGPESELEELQRELEKAEQAEAERIAKAEADARRAADCARRHREWPVLENDRLRDRRDRAMGKLEALYPEHKVFALAALNDELRASLVKLSRACGYESTDALLEAHGFERISGRAVRALIPQVRYIPGSEPEVIRGKVEAILRRLEEYYPEKNIPGGLERDHKSLSGDISGVAQWLGYGSRREFLEAYGFRYDDSCVGGRPALEIRPILETLLREYGESETKPRTLSAISREHPEYRAQLKTLSNRARELFGEPLAEHLKKLNILAK